MYRELYEEVGLFFEDVEIVVSLKYWLCYKLFKCLICRDLSFVCIG